MATLGVWLTSSCAPLSAHEAAEPNHTAELQTFLSRPKNDPNFNSGIDYLNENLRDTKMVGDPLTRRLLWPFHWDPGRCTSPRGDKLEVTTDLHDFDRARLLEASTF